MIDVHVSEGLTLPMPADTVEEVVRWVLEHEGVDEAEISVTFLADGEMADLNRKYLEHEGTTDVISFPLQQHGQPPVGDVYVGLGRALEQAAELDVTPTEEVLRLVIHGTLHVLGHDHPEGAERDGSPMYRRQEELLQGFLVR